MNILITGGSSGIGQAIAQACAQGGHDIFLVAQEVGKLERVANELTAATGRKVLSMTADVSDPKQVEAIQQRCRKEKFSPDVLVLNAGIWLSGGIMGVKPEEFDQIMHVNVASMFYFIKAFRETLKRSVYPRIIITGSTAGLEGHHRSGGSLYSVSKWAVHGLTVNLRQELMSDNIGVTHIAPGSVMSAMWDADEAEPKRMLEAADIGKVVSALLELSPQAVVEEIVIRPMGGNI